VNDKLSTEKHSPGFMIFVVFIVALFYVTHPIRPHYMSYPSPPAESAIPERVKLAMQILISVAFGAASLFMVIAKRFAPKDKHWAYATLGTILGFWLR
jgi:hypothetical protein